MFGFLFISMFSFFILDPPYFIYKVFKSMNFPVYVALTAAGSSEFEDSGS